MILNLGGYIFEYLSGYRNVDLVEYMKISDNILKFSLRLELVVAIRTLNV